MNLPLLQANQAGQGVQKRGLSGAVRPENGNDLTGLCAELDVEMQ
jgi:hypothetical protein